MGLAVYRFEDVEFRSHVIASSIERATEIFDKVMGAEFRELSEGSMEIYQIDGSTVLPISEDGSPPFVELTADEWIAKDPTPRFL